MEIENIHDILEGYFDRMCLPKEKRAYERIRCGLALVAYSAELSKDIEEERQAATKRRQPMSIRQVKYV